MGADENAESGVVAVGGWAAEGGDDGKTGGIAHGVGVHPREQREGGRGKGFVVRTVGRRVTVGDGVLRRAI